MQFNHITKGFLQTLVEEDYFGAIGLPNQNTLSNFVSLHSTFSL